MAEKTEIIDFRLLRGVRGGSRNAFTVGNGLHLGATRERGRSRETGPSHGCLAPAGGARRQQPGNWPRPGAARLGKAPHLIHGGPCLILPGRNVFFQDRHAGNRRNASRDDPGHGREHRRGPHAVAPRPEAVGNEAADTQRQRGGEHPRPGFCTISSAPGPESRARPAGGVTASIGGLIGCCLPTRQEDCLPAGCAQRCG